MTGYRNIDRPAAPQVVTIQWECVQLPDDDQSPPTERQDGYWPSLDASDAGYVGASVTPAEFAKMHEDAQARLDAFERGDWDYVGTLARATISVPIGGGSFCSYTLDSAGLWGTESDADPAYIESIFEEEKANLAHALEEIGRHVLADELAKLRAIAAAAMRCDIGSPTATRLAAFKVLGDTLVAYNGAPLAYRGPLNPDAADVYPYTPEEDAAHLADVLKRQSAGKPTPDGAA